MGARRRTGARMHRVADRRRRAAMAVSGSEETFSNVPFGTPQGIKRANCYAYALGVAEKASGDGESRKLQPGDIAGVGGSVDLGSCRDLRRRMGLDGRALGSGIRPVATAEEPCAKGWYKIMAFVDPSNDFHYYKQHRDVLYRPRSASNTPEAVGRRLGVPRGSATRFPDGRILVRDADVWSHKRGHATPPLLADSCGKVIRDPRRACRSDSRYDYKEFCGAFCVRNGVGAAATAAIANRP